MFFEKIQETERFLSEIPSHYGIYGYMEENVVIPEIDK